LIPVLRALMAVLFGGTAVWFMRYRYDRKEQSVWFFMWLTASAASFAFSAMSWWVRDMTISEDLWIASFVCLTFSVFLIFGFARSFSVEARFTLLFWALPLMLDIAIVVVGSQAIFRRDGNSWIPKGYTSVFYLQIALNSFYALLAVYYIVVLYIALKPHAQKQEFDNVRFIMAGLLITLFSISVGGWLRTSISPDVALTELGTIIGTLLILRGIVGPNLGFRKKKTQGQGDA
jgi:hypothetical protein